MSWKATKESITSSHLMCYRYFWSVLPVLWSFSQENTFLLVNLIQFADRLLFLYCPIKPNGKTSLFFEYPWIPVHFSIFSKSSWKKIYHLSSTSLSCIQFDSQSKIASFQQHREVTVFYLLLKYPWNGASFILQEKSWVFWGNIHRQQRQTRGHTELSVLRHFWYVTQTAFHHFPLWWYFVSPERRLWWGHNKMCLVCVADCLIAVPKGARFHSKRHSFAFPQA